MSSSASEGQLKQVHMCRTHVLKLSQEIVKYSEQCCANFPTEIIFKTGKQEFACRPRVVPCTFGIFFRWFLKFM